MRSLPFDRYAVSPGPRPTPRPLKGGGAGIAENEDVERDSALFSLPTRRIGPVDVAVVDRDTALSTVVKMLDSGAGGIVGFCNAHTVNMARANDDFAAALRKAVVFPDGIGVDLASKLLYGKPFPENLNGTDFTPAFLATLRKPTPIFLLGSAPGVADQVARVFENRYQNVRVVGTQHGFFSDVQAPALVKRIRASGARMVLVGMGHPRQEIWGASYGIATGALVILVGAILDFTAGRVRRAPVLMRKMRIEWMYRLLQEPRRLWKRYLIGMIQFAQVVMHQRLNLEKAARTLADGR